MLEKNCQIVTNNVERIINEIKNSNFSKIGIDGTSGSGKSTLSKSIENNLNIKHICVDNYLEPNQGTYLPNIDYNRLKMDLDKTTNFVIEGICLLEILEAIELRVDLLIYIKRCSHGLWSEGDKRICDINEDVDEFIKEEQELYDFIPNSENDENPLGIDEEIIRYHAKKCPHIKAEIIFQREVD